MKKLIYFIALLSTQNFLLAQNFTWVKGSNSSGLPGVYGTQGSSATVNNPGGRHGCGKWVDAAGNLWLFGGEGYSSSSTVCWMNDLWKYDISTKTWTWIRGSNGPNQLGVYGTMGVASATNEPGAREFPTCWTDAAGNFWMFGGDGLGTTPLAFPGQPEKLGDLWKYDPTSNQWTWIKGFNVTQQSGVYGTTGSAAPSNLPGGRYGAGGWVDASGDFWLFGGRGYGAAASLQGYLNDLWKYNIATNQWTWVNGTTLINQNGIYGTLSVPNSSNAPGGRYFSSIWQDATGNVYCFGGYGLHSSAFGYLNDMWKYNPSTNIWTWINGSSTANPYANYGTQGVTSALTTPGGRYSSAYWTDWKGTFWLFGGIGLTANTSVYDGTLNDLFKYEPLTNQWTWVKGSVLHDQNGTYGTQGVAAANNIPGGRQYNTCWTGKLGIKLWLFGGQGFDATSTAAADHMNDLWVFGSLCNPDSIAAAPANVFCSGASPSLSALNSGTNTSWYSTASSTTALGTGSTLSLGQVTVTAPTTFSYYAESNSCTLTPRAAIVLTVNPIPTLTATTTKTLLCKGEFATLTVSGANTYTWNTTPIYTVSSVTIAPTITTTFVVSGTNIYNCTNTVALVQKIIICPGVKENNSEPQLFSVYPNPGNGSFILENNFENNKAKLILVNTLGQRVFEKELIPGVNEIKTGLDKGLYYGVLWFENKKAATTKILIE